MTPRRYLPIREFQSGGYLQEVNRRLLHPLGLALEAKLADEPVARLVLTADGLDRLRTLAAKARDHGLLSERDAAELLERIAAAPVGDGFLSGVWDARDDPEGIIFEPPAPDPELAWKVLDELHLRSLPREALLGYVFQPPEFQPETES